VWVANAGDGTVMRINTRQRKVVQTIPVGDSPDVIAVGGGYVWVANARDGTVTRINQATGAVVNKAIPVGGSPRSIAFAEGSLWVVDSRGGKVRQIDASTGTPGGPIAVGHFPTAVAIDKGIVWVTAWSQSTPQYHGVPGTVLRIEQGTGKIRS
jgi:YVTN family beta-propeller protein